MKKLMKRLAIGTSALLLGAAATPVAYAQSERENSTFTTTEVIDVGGFTLQPGTYLIKVVMLASNRNTIQVTNVEQTKVFANVLATPHPIRGDEAIPSSRYVYYAATPGQPRALRTWFARDTPNGQDILYPKARALELAVVAKEPVLAIAEDVKETEYKTVPLVIVTPDRQVKPYEPPAPTAVVAENRPAKRLPRTASQVPLVALAGLLSLGGAFGLRALSNRAL